MYYMADGLGACVQFVVLFFSFKITPNCLVVRPYTVLESGFYP